MAAAFGRTKAGVVRSILRTPGMRREEREIHALAEEKLAFFGQRLMGYRWDQPAYSLSYANRRRLEIARATATGARILLLDEPAAGMNPKETHEITELIAKLRTDGDNLLKSIQSAQSAQPQVAGYDALLRRVAAQLDGPLARRTSSCLAASASSPAWVATSTLPS